MFSINSGKHGGRQRLPAASPATAEPRRPQERDTLNHASRMAAGRTPEILLHLQSLNLFRFCDDVVPRVRNPLPPQRGLTADLAGVPVYILDVFARGKVAHADVARVQRRSRGNEYTLGSLQTVPCKDLSNARLDLQVARVTATSVILLAKPRESGQSPRQNVLITAVLHSVF